MCMREEGFFEIYLPLAFGLLALMYDLLNK